MIYFHGAVSAPMSVYPSVSKFLFWAGKGVFEADCRSDGYDHEVALVGFGSEDGVDYWIAKNALSTYWGDNGYFKIKRGVNQCLIEECPATPMHIWKVPDHGQFTA